MSISFPDHLSLLAFFLDRRPQIVDDMEKHLLNVQGKATSRSRNRVDGERSVGAFSKRLEFRERFRH